MATGIWVRLMRKTRIDQDTTVECTMDHWQEALEEAWGKAATAVVSSAGRAGLEKDWAAGGLTPYVDLLMSQEDGSKTAQLQLAMARCDSPVRGLMLGDTDADGQAAREAGAAFFRIVPGQEAESWRRFREEILPRFLSGAPLGEA